jgi:hypothetical protein
MAHTFQAVQEELLAALLNVPVGQAAHCRSFVANGAVTTWVPAGQFDHGSQTVALGLVLWLPFGQGEQVRSAIDEPAELTTVPGAQSVFLTQMVAGSPSSSHVPSGHCTLGVVPPAQNSPALHFVHFGPAVGVAGALVMVPAWHSLAARQAT